MTNFARVVNGTAVDVSTDPTTCFHPRIAAEFVEVPAKVTHGWVLANGKWTAPVTVVSDPVTPVVLGNMTPTPPEFLLLLTLIERVEIRAARATNPVADDLLRMVDDTRVTVIELSNPGVQESINYLAALDPPLLSPERAARVLSGLSPLQ